MGTTPTVFTRLLLTALLAFSSTGNSLADDFGVQSPDDARPPVTHSREALPTAGYAYSNGAGSQNVWGAVEFLLWKPSSDVAPPLVTTSPTTVNSADAGALDQQETSILFGGGNAIDRSYLPGNRVSFGWWLDDCHCTGVGIRFALVDDEAVWFLASQAEIPVLARPFFNTSTVAEDALLLAYPGERSGSIVVSGHSDAYSGDIYLRRHLRPLHSGSLDVVFGYQFGRLEENITIATQSTFLVDSGTITQNTTVEMLDAFETRNEFHGGVIGLLATLDHAIVQWELLAKLGIGDMRHTALIRGQRTVTPPGNPSATTNTGLLAQPSNSGQFTSRSSAVIPEFGVNANWRVSPSITLKMGYSAIYWSDVMRPGAQIDTNVDPTQSFAMVGSRPAFLGQIDDYWLHGLSVGLTCRY